MKFLSGRRAAVLVVAASIIGAITSPASAAALPARPTAGTWGTDGRVDAILPLAGGSKIIAGSFSHLHDPAGDVVPAGNLALLDPAGVLVAGWGASTDGPVRALAESGGTLYIGGSFDHVDSVAHPRLAAVNLATGALETTFTATTSGTVLALSATSTALFVGGSFTHVRTPASGRTESLHLVKLDLNTGALDANWLVNPDGPVHALLASPDGSTLYAGGTFTAIGGDSRTALAALSTGDPATVLAFQITTADITSPVFALALSGTTLVVGANNGNGGSCTGVDAGSGARIWDWIANGNVQAVAVVGDDVYCGGHFSTLGQPGLPRKHLAVLQVDGSASALTAWSTRINSALGVFALATDGSSLYVGGDFTRMGPAPDDHFAQFTG